MSVAAQSVAQGENRFLSPLAICGVVSILLLAGLLRVFGVSLLAPTLVAGTATFLWVALRHPLGSLGGVLVFMPMLPLTFLLAKFFGPPYIAKLEGFDRVVMLVLVFALWWRSRVKLATPDWFLLACFGLAVLRFAFGGMLMPLLSDFNFIIAYAAGRVAVLSLQRQELWAKRAVWIIAALAVLGMVEVFIIGDGPRTVLYLAVAPEQAVLNGDLGLSFRATGYSGMREAATALGPLTFAPLCMMALILWWVYFRDRLPGFIVAAGLLCTVTRASWFGTALAMPFLATIMGQTKRFFRYAALALVVFAAAIPVLGLSDYLFATKTLQDPSAAEHREDLSIGFHFMADHPLGAGPGNAGRWATDRYNNTNAVNVDDTYLILAGVYGIPTALCFVGFLVTALWISWRQRTQVGYAAAAIIVGFCAIITFFIAHDVFTLACWIWFPVGQAVRCWRDRQTQPPNLDGTLIRTV